jgi:hypothetical protein
VGDAGRRSLTEFPFDALRRSIRRRQRKRRQRKAGIKTKTLPATPEK